MMEWLADSALGKVADWTLDKLPGLRKRMGARSALKAGDSLVGLTTDGQVAAAVEKLLRERGLSSPVTQIPAAREWLASAQTQALLTQYVLARIGGNRPLAATALASLSQGYSDATGEASQLAHGNVEAAANYVSTLISDNPNFVASQVAELAADNREQRLAQSAAPDLGTLRAEARGLLEQAPKAARLLDQRIPCSFAMVDKAGSHQRLDVASLISLLPQRKLVVIEGEGGSGKTTALVELGHALLAETGMPIPLYVSAANWQSSGLPLLAYLAALPGARRSAVDENMLSTLISNGSVALLLNGWNEIAAADKTRAISSAEDFLAGHPNALVISTSRRAEGPFAGTDGAVVTVLEFNWDRQRALIAQALPGEAGNGLLRRLQTDTSLRLTARNPLVLSSAIVLAQRGREVPGTLYGLLEAVLPVLEAPSQRQEALDDAPLYGQQRAYLKALARYLTAVGKVEMSLDEARQVVAGTAAELEKSGQIGGRGIEPAKVLDALSNTHLLHRERYPEILKFCHQRFQEFFAAIWVLEQLSLDEDDDAQVQSVVQEVFNHPAWTESLDLVAAKVATDRLLVPRARLIARALRCDLTLASKLAGAVHMGAEAGGPFAPLIEGIRLLHAAKSDGAEKHALLCMALTRSPVFANELIAVLGTTNRLDVLGLINDAGGFSIRSFGDDLARQFETWSTEQKHNLLQGLGSYQENIPFLESIARRDPDSSIRARSIATLAWEFPASDAALDAWFAVSDETKRDREAFQSALYVTNGDRMPALMLEVQQLAEVNDDKNLLLQLARELPMDERGFALEPAKQLLMASDHFRHYDDDIVKLVAKFDLDALQAIADEELLKHRTAPSWVASHLQSLPPDKRSVVFSRVFARAKTGNKDAVDGPRLGMLAGNAEVDAVLGEWLDVSPSAPESTDLERLLSRILGAASTEHLSAAVLARKGRLSYSQVRRTLELLSHPRTVERTAIHSEQQPRVLSPNTAQALVDAYWDLTEPAGTQSHGVKAAMCLLLSLSDAVGFETKIFDGLMLEAERRALQVRQRRPASGLSYGYEFERAAVACGTSMAKRLLPLLDAHDESNVLLSVLQQIAVRPWSRAGFRTRVDIAGREQRLSEGFVLRQRDADLQQVTDQLASTLARRLEASEDAPLDPRENLFHRRWSLMTSLAELPTTVGALELRKNLLRSDVPTDRFSDALNALASQGATINDHEVVAALRQHFANRVQSMAWFDQQDTSLPNLAVLHFLVSENELTVADLGAMVDQWLSKAPSYEVVRKLREARTPAAMGQLTRLLNQGRLQQPEEALKALLVDRLGRDYLLEYVLDGSLFNFIKGYINVRQVASVLGGMVDGNQELLHKILSSCAIQDSVAAGRLAFELVSAVSDPDPEALNYLLTILRKAGQTGEGRMAVSFESLFEEREPVDGSINTHHLYPRACNHLRAKLFELAMTNGDSLAPVAAEILFSIEERRFSLGRPHDEPRHPNFHSKHLWPQCLVEAA